MFDFPHLSFAIQNRESIRFYRPPSTESVAVRITSGDGTFEKTDHAYRNVLLIKFDDAGPDDPEGSRQRLLMTAENAVTICDFFEVHRDAPFWVFHCDAGRSRSPAIALSLGEFLGNKCIIDAIYEHPAFHPNSHVLSTMRQEIRRRG